MLDEGQIEEKWKREGIEGGISKSKNCIENMKSVLLILMKV